MRRRLPGRLLALTPGLARSEADCARLLSKIGEAFEAGLPAVLLREPLLPDGHLLLLAQQVVDLARRFEEQWVGVHDRVHVCRAAGADGVHLGFRSLAPEVARLALAEECTIGFSAHAHDEARSWSGADYLTFGPVRETTSKRGLLEPTGVEGLRRAVLSASQPVLALGGLQPDDVLAMREAGAAGVAVLSGILGAADVGPAVRRFMMALEPSGGGPS